MKKTTYQTPELRDSNDNIIQPGSFGKHTALANATNNGWTDYVVNNLEVLHDSIEGVESAITSKTGTTDYDGNVWFADTGNAAKLVKNEDFTYNPALGKMEVPVVKQKDSLFYRQVKGGWYTNSGSNVSGSLVIKPPVTKSTVSNNHYLYFGVYVYDHSHSGQRAILRIGGMVNSKTLAWTYPTADWIGGDASVRVTFGDDGTSPLVAIGKPDSTAWTYPKVVIFDLVTSNANLEAGLWDITLSSAEPINVSKVIRYPSITEPPPNYPVHNVPYRNVDLGTGITDDQLAAIRDGSFEGINVGDWWTINGNTWIVAGINYFKDIGNPRFTANHIVVFPQRVLYMKKMNGTATTAGGYVSSELFADLETTALPIIEEAFGAGNILSHAVYLPTTCVGGEYTGGSYQTRKVDLMNEIMVFGHQRFGNVYAIGTQSSRLPVFTYKPHLLRALNTTGSTARKWWLYDVVSAAAFSAVSAYGVPTTLNANYDTVTGIRPFFCVG